MASRKKTISSDRSWPRCILVFFILFFFVLTVAWLYRYDNGDSRQFILPWMKNMKDHGILAMYRSDAEGAQYGMDYPPLYYFCLYVISGRAAALLWENGSVLWRVMLAVPSALAYAFLGAYLYRTSVRTGWALHFWYCCIPVIANICALLQSDTVLILEIFFFLHLHNRHRNALYDSLLFAILCLTKLQGCYLLPVYLIMLYECNGSLKQKLGSMAIAVLGAVLVWLPWIVAERNLLLPFRIYFGGFTGQLVISDDGVINLWALLKAFIGQEALFEAMSGGLFSYVSYAMILVCICWCVVYYVRHKDITLCAFLYLMLIYFLTLNQRARYCTYALAPLLELFLYTDHLQNHKGILLVLSTFLFTTCNNAVLVGTFVLSEKYALLAKALSIISAVSVFLFLYCFASYMYADRSNRKPSIASQ